MDRFQLLTEIATAVADGKTVDWAAIEAQALSKPEAELLRRLRLVERIAITHASAGPDSADRLHDSLLHPLGDGQRTDDGAPAPVTWGPLEIIEKIGSGTFGDVYRAHDPRLDRAVALKLLRGRERRDEVLESAVIEEGRLLARVRHPNVVAVYGAERIGGRVGLWMEFVDGRTLEQDVRDHGPFSADELMAVGSALCRALSAVHEAGLLHRDVKAQNVMRDREGRVVLTDFGAGRAVADMGAARELAGSPLYLAPEVLRGEATSVGSDVYSLGVLLYYLATSSFHVTGQSLDDLRSAHARGKRVPVRTYRPDLPQQLASAIDRATAASVARRYRSPLEFEAALTGVSRVSLAMRGHRALVSHRVWVALLVTAACGLLYVTLNTHERWDRKILGSAEASNGGLRFESAGRTQRVILRSHSEVWDATSGLSLGTFFAISPAAAFGIRPNSEMRPAGAEVVRISPSHPEFVFPWRRGAPRFVSDDLIVTGGEPRQPDPEAAIHVWSVRAKRQIGSLLAPPRCGPMSGFMNETELLIECLGPERSETTITLARWRISPAGDASQLSWLVSGDFNDTNPTRVLAIHPSGIVALAHALPVDPSHKMAIELFNAKNGVRVRSGPLPFDAAVARLAISSDGRWLAVWKNRQPYNQAFLLSTTDLKSAEGIPPSAIALDTSANLNVLLPWRVATETMPCLAWSKDGGTELSCPDKGVRGFLHSVAPFSIQDVVLNEDGRDAVVNLVDAVILLETQSGMITRIRLNGERASARKTINPDTFLVETASGVYSVYDFPTGQLVLSVSDVGEKGLIPVYYDHRCQRANFWTQDGLVLQYTRGLKIPGLPFYRTGTCDGDREPGP